MSSCDEVELELEPWVRGELAPDTAATVKAHVATCAACRESARWLGPLARRLEALPAGDVDADALADRVISRARARERALPWATGGALALVLLVSVGVAKLALGPTDLRPVGQPSSAGADGPRVDDPRVDGPSVVDPRVDGPRVDGPRVDGPRVDGPRVDGPRVDGPRVDDPRVDDPRIDDPRIDDPRIDDPRIDDPRVDAPPGAQPDGTSSGPDVPRPEDLTERDGWEPASRDGPEDLAVGPHGPGAEPARPADGAPAAPGSSPQDARAHERRSVARVDRVLAEARVRRSGDERWRPLAVGDALAGGDEVEALRGPLDIALLASPRREGEEGPAVEGGATTPPDERTSELEVEDRLLLAAGARATLGAAGLPGATGERARLDAGDAFVVANGDLAVRAGACRVVVRAGDAGLRLDRRGDVDVAGLAGRVDVRAGEAEVALAAGQGLAVDRRGRAGRPAAIDVEPPAWVGAARALVGRRLAGSTAGTGRLELLLGEPRDGVAVGTATPAAPTPTTRAVTFGLGRPRAGAWRHVAGSTLRVVYRLSATAPLGITISDVGRGQDLQAVLAAPRAGAWTVLDVDLDRLAGAADPALRLEPGAELDLVTISAHGEASPVHLEVALVEVIGATR